MDKFGLPSPKSQKTEVEKEALLYSVTEQQTLYDHLEATFPSNAEQRAVIDAAMSAVHNPTRENRFIFASGVAGSGKTLLSHKVAAKLRGKGKIVKICASTTLAAGLYKNAQTAHTLFKYPVPDTDACDSDKPPECRYA